MSQGESMPRENALIVFEAFQQYLRDNEVHNLVNVAGSLRRGLQVVNDIDVLISVMDEDDIDKVNNALESLFGTLKSQEGVARSGVFRDEESGLDAAIDVSICVSGVMGAAWMHTTGSKEFNIHCRALAKQKGWRLNQYGLFDAQFQLVCDCSEEEIVMRTLGFPVWIAPELRSVAKDYRSTDL